MKFIPLKGEKDMKKWLVLLSTMLLIFGIVAGCGSKDSDDIKSVTGEGQKKETEAKDKDKEKDKEEELVVDEPEEPEEVVNKDEDKEKDKEKKDKKKDKKKSNTDKKKDKDKELLIEESKKTEEVVKKEEDKEKDKEKKDKKKDKKKSNTDDLLMGVDEHMVKNVEVVSQQELDESLTFGPLNLDINKVQLSELEISSDYVSMFDGKEEVSLITFEMRAENTSDKDLSFYPDQSTMTTSSGEQVEAVYMLNEPVGGDFFGEVWKEGNVSFAIDTPLEELEHITLIIAPGHDDDYDNLGKQEKLKIELD